LFGFKGFREGWRELKGIKLNTQQVKIPLNPLPSILLNPLGCTNSIGSHTKIVFLLHEHIKNDYAIVI
jgi:hypothetical protein